MRLFLQLLLLLPVLGASATTPGGSLPSGIEEAKEMLAAMPLAGPEGLWEFAPDEVTLLILRDADYPGRYNLIVMEAVDCRLLPGVRIGSLEESVEPFTYRLNLFTSWKKGVLDFPVKGVAKYDTKSESLRLEGKSIKVALTPSVILPNLLNLLRLRVAIKTSDPEAKLPKGLRRIFPEPVATPDNPIYL